MLRPGYIAKIAFFLTFQVLDGFIDSPLSKTQIWNKVAGTSLSTEWGGGEGEDFRLKRQKQPKLSPPPCVESWFFFVLFLNSCRKRLFHLLQLPANWFIPFDVPVLHWQWCEGITEVRCLCYPNRREGGLYLRELTNNFPPLKTGSSSIIQKDFG